MGLGDYLSAKAENVMMLGATGFAQANPHAALEIGAILDSQLDGFAGEGHRAHDILNSLGMLVRLAEASPNSATETKYRYMQSADFHKRAGERSEMYACSMLAALFRRSVAAATGRPKDVDSFNEMATAVANSIAVYRLSDSFRDDAVDTEP